jgi:hypothetical protein
MSVQKFVVELGPPPEGINTKAAIPLEDIVNGKTRFGDDTYIKEEGEIIPIPHGSVRNYARKLVEDGMDPKTKVVLAVHRSYSEEELNALNTMSATERRDWINKTLIDGAEVTKLERKDKKK